MAECKARARKPGGFPPGFRVAYIILYVPTGFREKKAEAGEKSGKPGVLWGAVQHRNGDLATFIFCQENLCHFQGRPEIVRNPYFPGNSILENGEVLEVEIQKS